MTESTKKPDPDEPRSIVLEREIAAPPEEVWEALTTPQGLRNWFALDARIEPREGGSVWISWGPGSEGEAPIHAWNPPEHFGWTERHGTDDAGRPVELVVDFHVEGRGGTTVVRLVHSGFGASEDWDEMVDGVTDGWTYFLFNLAFYFLRHRGRRRTLVWRRVATEAPREAVWARLVGSGLLGTGVGGGATTEVVIDRARPAEVVSQRVGHHFAAHLPDLDESILFVELEGLHVGFWLSTYELDAERVEELQRALDRRTAEALGT